MRVKRFAPWLVLAAIGAAALAAALGTNAATKKTHADFKLAVVTDIGGLNDRSFNQSANAGRLAAEKELGIKTRVFVTRTAGDRIPNLRAAAQQGYDLVIGTGFFMGEPLGVVAPAFRKTKFAGIDVDQSFIKGKPKNVRGLLFREQEAGYLVGYLAALEIKREHKKNVFGAIGANTVPPILRYISGYKQGVHKADPKATVLVNFANDPTFSDQAKCKEQTLNQIAKGSRVEFAIAGACGLGTISAAKDKGLWAIGVDVDQGYLGPQMLTSAMKRVDRAVVLAAKDAMEKGDAWKGGSNTTYTTKDGGIDYGKPSSKVPKSIVAKVNAIKKQIASGKIHVK